MPRTPRFVVPGVTLHVTQRGHDGQPCFFGESDYLAYLSYLAEFAPKFSCSVHAYCLMTNHVHLLVTPHAPDSCARLMKNVGQNYVQRINSRRGRSGTLWEGRPWSCPVTTERHVLACYRYVGLNPPRACDIALEVEVIDEIRKATRGGYAVDATRRPRGRPRPPVMRKIGSVPI